jgi:hypothetical protein
VRNRDEKLTIGWREWVALPGLGVDGIKAKIDSGARSSALHAYDVEIVDRGGQEYVVFKVLPYQRSTQSAVHAEAPLLEVRSVRNSGGHVENRPVIETPLKIGEREHLIELTLTSRDEMGFRLLLGRQAVRKIFVIDPGRSFLQGRQDRTEQSR